jgi:hypothetical protein
VDLLGDVHIQIKEKLLTVKKTIFIAFLIINFIGYSQSKKELIAEIEGYKKTKLINSTYDFTFKEIFFFYQIAKFIKWIKVIIIY